MTMSSCFVPAIHPPGGLASNHMPSPVRGSIWREWFLAGNNVPTTPQPGSLLVRTGLILDAAEEHARADYEARAFDRLHLGQHENGQELTIRPQNTPYWEIRGRLLQEEV